MIDITSNYDCINEDLSDWTNPKPTVLPGFKPLMWWYGKENTKLIKDPWSFTYDFSDATEQEFARLMVKSDIPWAMNWEGDFNPLGAQYKNEDGYDQKILSVLQTARHVVGNTIPFVHYVLPLGVTLFLKPNEIRSGAQGDSKRMSDGRIAFSPYPGEIDNNKEFWRPKVIEQLQHEAKLVDISKCTWECSYIGDPSTLDVVLRTKLFFIDCFKTAFPQYPCFTWMWPRYAMVKDNPMLEEDVLLKVVSLLKVANIVWWGKWNDYRECWQTIAKMY